MSVPKHLLLGGWYPQELIVNQLRYRLSDSYENEDIEFSTYTICKCSQKLENITASWNIPKREIYCEKTFHPFSI